MSKKKLVKKNVQNDQSNKTVQYVAGGVILIVLVSFAVMLIPWNKLGASSSQSSAICESFADIPASEQYASAPPQMVDSSASYFATVEMEKGGQFKIELYPDKAPITVNSFIFLSCKGFFNGVTFHRVLDGFMAQGGDPTGTGSGGPGYQFVNEDSDLTFDKEGVLAMANAGRDTNGSQFFITFGPQPSLNGGYTIFGQVIEGMDVVNSITRRDPQQNPNFEGDKILSITITGE
ncbi:MAG TPA: peptidylprolyl isomerase [Anaerolineales bacterium]|nr:peptidylprolyl isomerase [Anaerolineales bacterium]HNB34982.1 peptidylprolyl isomerase [Anaerolineales bacterium]